MNDDITLAALADVNVVEYCWTITLCTSQCSAATFYRRVGKFILFQCRFSHSI